MELYSDTTRFALACNSSEKIIEPIQSRCAMIRYSKVTRKFAVDRGLLKDIHTVFLQLSDAQVLAKIMDVCQRESIEYSDDGLEAVVFTAQGDMRQGKFPKICIFMILWCHF